LRVKKLTENTLKTIKKERQNVTINQLYICLGGDFINNYLHEHDTQMNYMSPIEASTFAKEVKRVYKDRIMDVIITQFREGE